MPESYPSGSNWSTTSRDRGAYPAVPVAARQQHKRWRSYEKTISLQCIAPATRIVIVEAWSNDDGSVLGHYINPVVAIRTSVADVYIRVNSPGDCPRYSPTHAGMIRHGWSYEDRREGHEYVVVGECGLMDASVAFEGDNMAWRAVACPWPPSRDEKRLEAIIAEVREEAIAKARKAAR